MTEPAAVNVLFDLDGTLTDPGDGFVACIAHALSKLECRSLPDREIRKHVGPPLEETLAHLIGRDNAKVQAAVAFYRERYGSKGFLENSIYAGIEAALAALRSNGVELFLATSKPFVFAERILAHFRLTEFFKTVYGSELDGTHANKAQLIAHILRRESLAAESTIMVGDRAHDIVGAASNGLRTIGVLWGYGSRQELTDAGADVLCDHPSQLPGMLSSNHLMQPTGRKRPAADQER